MEVAQSQAAAHFVEGQHLLRAQTLFALQLFALVGDFTSFLLCLDDVESITGGRRTVQAQNEGRFGRAGLLHALVTLVEHGLHLAIMCTGTVAT